MDILNKTGNGEEHYRCQENNRPQIAEDSGTKTFGERQGVGVSYCLDAAWHQFPRLDVFMRIRDKMSKLKKFSIVK